MTPALLALPALGCEIACYEAGPATGPALLLLPGNSLSCASTYSVLWADPALAHFRLVAFDWPGCGASPWADPAAYGLRGLRRVLLAAWETLHLAGTLVVAHSLAGHVVLDVLNQLAAVRDALLVGTPPLNAARLGTAFFPDPRMSRFYEAQLSPDALDSLADLMLPSAHRPAHAAVLRQALQQTDPAFRTALAADIGAGHVVDEVAVLGRTAVPLAFAQGEAEAVVDPAYFATLPAPFARWGPALHRLGGAGHLPMLETPVAFRRLLLDFAAACPMPAA